MFFSWLNAREAIQAGSALADAYPVRTPPGEAVREFLQRGVHELRARNLNFYTRAKFANAFRWRLLENGVQAETAAELTQTLLIVSSTSSPVAPTAIHPIRRPGTSPETILREAEQAYSRADYALAADGYQAYLALRPRDADALNNLGASYSKLGRYTQAQEHFRKAIAARPKYAEAHSNLGSSYLMCGQFPEAESSLRRAVNFRPADPSIRSSLALTLIQLGRLDDARGELEKVLRGAPRYPEGLHGMGMICMAEGRFEEAEDYFKRALVANPQLAAAWSALAGVRKMSSADKLWLKRAEQAADSLSAPPEEAGVRFAIGKYFDDIGEYAKAFKSYARANELLRTIAPPYARTDHTQFVNDMIRVYTPESISSVATTGSGSTRPVLVVGMMRSGTSLAEQILASHPAVGGAGELTFWNGVVRKHEEQLRRSLLGESLRRKLAEEYQRKLSEHCPDARHVVDKSPLNSDYLGVIHSVFPQARFIYMRRDPIDTCLSCYFQPFPVSLNFCLDLSDLAHYFTEHARLMAHWRKILPAGTLLEVPYEELVADQEHWTRKILDFLGLEWDERCVQFHKTQRAVLTASRWQVRQPMYRDSVQRWRNYSRFIGPLSELKPL
jgi:tetratricopeptide (TPR) repeat protein